MPSIVQAFCPDAYHIRLGKIENNQVFHDKLGTGISVNDIVTDPANSIKKIVFKCVSSETVFGILGISLLKPE
jgi:hypothetical protein